MSELFDLPMVNEVDSYAGLPYPLFYKQAHHAPSSQHAAEAEMLKTAVYVDQLHKIG